MLSVNDAAIFAEDAKTHISHPFPLLGFLTFITESHLHFIALTDEKMNSKGTFKKN